MLNAISVDVEEYFHATNFDPYVGPAKWHAMPSRIDATNELTLSLFEEAGVKGTFFILGSLARRQPHIVRMIAETGHEIGSHGYAHRLAYEQTPRAFFRDVYRSKALLEDLSGTEVRGYRAPNFSIIDSNQWAYDELIRAGYFYDSSLYPVRHPRYGNRDKGRTPQLVRRSSGHLIEFPLATTEFRLPGGELRLGVAGGAYWRFFPKPFVRWCLERTNAHDGLPFSCYFHPWELDRDQPRVAGLPLITRLRHYGGTANFVETLRYFLRAFNFAPLWDTLLEQYSPLIEEARRELASRRETQSA